MHGSDGDVFCCQTPTSTIQVAWQPPPIDYIKINLYGNVVQGVLQGGAVYRNSMGIVEAAFARRMGRNFAYKAETLTAFKGVSNSLMMGWNKLILESDFTYVVSLF